jgi:hypothetical protein
MLIFNRPLENAGKSSVSTISEIPFLKGHQKTRILQDIATTCCAFLNEVHEENILWAGHVRPSFFHMF